MRRELFPHQGRALAMLRESLIAGLAEAAFPNGPVFRRIAQFERYMISDVGIVFSGIRACRFLSATVSPQGYPYVALMGDDGRPQKRLVHRLVAEAFLPNPCALPTVNHLNGDKKDARVSNLEWCSYAENNDHARRTGLSSAIGQTHYAAKLTDQDVLEVRRLLKQGALHREVAARFKVNRQHITKIANGQARVGALA